METFFLVIGWVKVVWILFLPQFLGVLLHFRMPDYPKSAGLAGFFLTMILSLFLQMILVSPMIPKEDHCGLPVMAAMMVLMFFMVIQIFVSLTSQLIMVRKGLSKISLR